jgi:hypothetical protein
MELADWNERDWYNREILVGAAARTNLDLLFFILTKKPNEFNLSFTRMCVRKGFIEVMDWWKKWNLLSFLLKLRIVDNGECWMIGTRMNIN